MSASQPAIPLRSIGDVRRVALAAPLLASALVAAALAAAAPIGVTRLSASDALRSGRAISLARLAVAGATLVELEAPEAGATLLAVSRDGRAAAVADRVGEPSGTLTLATDDGAQLLVAFPGLLAATFGADGSWLAVIDGRGALWTMDAASGVLQPIADGPFIGTPTIADDGSLLLLAVPSVEAPYQSSLVRLDLGTGVAEPISDAELVYAVYPLDGGDLAVVSHEVTGTEVARLARGVARPLAALGPGAVNVAVAHDGRIAFERAGDGIFVIDAPGSAERGIGAGARPCFDPSGSALLVERDGKRLALGVDGSLLAETAELAAFAGSAGCQS
jgi:hypothetical protein